MAATITGRRRKAPSPKCDCGCGQAPVKTTRLRLCECECGRKIRETREWLGHGTLSCPCGGVLEPVCLFDRAMLPGDDGAVYVELAGRSVVSGVKSDAGKLGGMRAAMRAACKVDGCNRKRSRESVHCATHAAHDLPF